MGHTWLHKFSFIPNGRVCNSQFCETIGHLRLKRNVEFFFFNVFLFMSWSLSFGLRVWMEVEGTWLALLNAWFAIRKSRTELFQSYFAHRSTLVWISRAPELRTSSFGTFFGRTSSYNWRLLLSHCWSLGQNRCASRWSLLLNMLKRLLLVQRHVDDWLLHGPH